MPAKPRIRSVETIAESRLFRIEELHLTFSNGVERVYERMVGDYPDSVIIAPFLDNETLLMIREYSAAIDAYELTLPKGLVDDGEDFFEAANRELQEEIGYRAGNLDYLCPLRIAPGYIDHTSHVIRATGLSPSRLPGDEPEALEIIPCSIGDIDDIIAREDVTDARTIATLYLVNRQ
ncbi:MAG: ADP compounds hydrolase NudE [Gammaproteobacteria bacterium]|jgi:ADP-ribose diphosphatase